MVVIAFVLGFTAIIGVICSFFLSPDGSVLLSNVSTIMSIVLGIMSIVYSYRCNKSTDALLNRIEEEFEKVSEYATTGMVNTNVNSTQLENVTRMMKNRADNLLPNADDTNPVKKE